MPKFKVTQNMGASLRNLRTKRNIKAVDIAKAINKTGAYISKLENGVLNTIAEEDLITIINTLSKDKKEFDEAIMLLLEDTTMEYSEEESKNEEWKMNIDLFYRYMPIPSEYREFVINEMNSIGISVKELVEHINANYELYDNDEYPSDVLDKAEKNHWIFNGGKPFIVLDVTEHVIADIINGEADDANYSTFLCILVSIFRLEKFSYDDSYKKARNILSNLKIYTISEKEERMRSYDSQNELHSVLDQKDNLDLSESDRQLLNTLNDLVKRIVGFSEICGINYANKKMTTLVNNLKNDPVLFMGFIGVDLSKLQNSDFQIKKEFVKALNSLVEEYSIKESPTPIQELI